MGSFVPGTQAEQRELLEAAGYASMDDLFASVPEEVRLKGLLPLEEGRGEMQALRHMQDLAGQNTVFPTIFRGAGAYHHYIPSIVGRVTSKETFLTAYTPYQAEISQGILQSIFEYQTMICELTGMDVSNASVYDGPTATAEGAALCVDRKRDRVLMSAAAHPMVKSVTKTYCAARGIAYQEIPETSGRTSLEALKELLDETCACVVLQQPNYYGILEDAEEIGAAAHEKGAKFIMNCNPMTLGLLKTPAECGADLAVGEGQPLGLPLSFGGPYLGYMACRQELMRRMPGRIVGETVDHEGNRAFVLTLQAREQHIKREKASSNVCSNEALCALTAAVYLAAVGPSGLREVAGMCYERAHELQEKLSEAGLSLCYEAPFFHEFVTRGKNNAKMLKKLEENGILGGLMLDEERVLWCATEMNTPEEIAKVAALVREVEA